MVDSSQYTPQSLELRRRLAASMLQSGTDFSPVQSPWQGLARVAQAGIGGYNLYRADQQEAGQQAASDQALLATLGGGGGADPAAMGGAAPVAGAQPGATGGGQRQRFSSPDQVPPELKRRIAALLANPSTRQMGLALIKQISTPALETDKSADLQAFGQYRRDAAAAGQPEPSYADFLRFKNGLDISRAAAGRSTTNVTVSTGSKEFDKQLGGDLAEFVGGGFADVQKNLGQLEEAAQALESGQNITGPEFGIGSAILGDDVMAGIAPGATDIREQVEEVAQRNLRLVLGAQFTQQEGDRLIARAFNKNLPEKANAARVRNLMASIEAAARQKAAAAQYLQKNGTLAGFDGAAGLTLDDIAADFDRRNGGAQVDPMGLR